MATPRTDAWSAARQTFADQFEKYGNGFVYRRSQKGEATPLSPQERDKFVDEFNRNLRRAIWIFSLGLAIVVGGIILFFVLRGSALFEPAIVLGFVAAAIPYFAFYRWAWAAPARELAGRTPVARERSPDEVKRIRFRRITYGQLAGAGVAGLALPLLEGARRNVLVGWDRVWLVFGGALVALAAVQAFRKWRFEQWDAYAHPAAAPITADTVAPDNKSSRSSNQFLRYVPLAVIVVGGAIIAFTPDGKQFAHAPSFFPVIMVGCACWALFTVWRGFRVGEIQPFERYDYVTYERETQPKRFWASMAWNGFFACMCLWLAFTLTRNGGAQAAQDRCYNEHNQVDAAESSKACTDLIEGRARLTYMTRADAYVYRAIADQRRGDSGQAFADYTQAIALNPRDYYAYFDRGLLSLDEMHSDAAVTDFSRAHEIDPKPIWPIANRGMAYAQKNDRMAAEKDFAVVRSVDPTNLVIRHGEGALDMGEGNLEGAVAEFTAALRQDPSDLWSLQTRADAYQQMGDFEKARADRERLEQISRRGT